MNGKKYMDNNITLPEQTLISNVCYNKLSYYVVISSFFQQGLLSIGASIDFFYGDHENCQHWTLYINKWKLEIEHRHLFATLLA